MKRRKGEAAVHFAMRKATDRLTRAERELGRAKLAWSTAYNRLLTTWPRSARRGTNFPDSQVSG